MAVSNGKDDGQQQVGTQPSTDEPTQTHQEPAPWAEAEVFEDPDDAALKEAVADLEREDDGGTPHGTDPGGTQNQPGSEAQPGAEAAAEPAQAAQEPQQPQAAEEGSTPGQQTGPGPVPYDRFSTVVRERNQAAEAAQYWKGVADARAQMPQTAGQQQQQQQQQSEPQQTVEEQIASLREQKRAVARQYDQTEISYEDAVTRTDAIEDQIQGLRHQQAREQSQPQQPQPQKQQMALSDQTLLAEQAQKLNADHPYLPHMTKEQILFLGDIVKAEAAANGQPIAGGALGTFQLRAAVAQLSDAFGPRWLPNVQVQAQQPQTTPNGGQHQQQPGAATTSLSPAADARLTKLQMAETMPPNTQHIGGAGASAALPSDSQLEVMTEEQWAAVPASTKQQLLFGGVPGG